MPPRSPESTARVEPPSPFTAVRDGVRVRVRLSPGAASDRVDEIFTDAAGVARLRVAVTAPAERGRANEAMIALLADTWRLPKSVFRLTSGATDRRKTVLLTGESAPLAARLKAWAAALPPAS
jgi:uncharacterized protein (TIGR00251 family)